MDDFGTHEYWEQQRLEQLQWDQHQEELRMQEEQQYIEAQWDCICIARDWLLGELSETEAIDYMSYTGLGNDLDTLLSFAQDVLDME